MVNLKAEGKNIAQTSAKLELESFLEKTKGKFLKKKLLLSMTVNALKSMCAKVFKGDVLEMHLEYRGPEDTQDYILDEEFRQLSFYSMTEGGRILVKDEMYKNMNNEIYENPMEPR